MPTTNCVVTFPPSLVFEPEGEINAHTAFSVSSAYGILSPLFVVIDPWRELAFARLFRRQGWYFFQFLSIYQGGK
jgi:hypothetical protein